MPFGATPGGIFYWRIERACKRHVYNVISGSDIACDIMNARHLAKIKRTLLELARSPAGVKAIELEGFARALGRELTKRGKEPTFIRRADPQLPSPLSIPRHAADLRIGTAKNIIRALLDDVSAWESYLQGGDDGDT